MILFMKSLYGTETTMILLVIIDIARRVTVVRPGLRVSTCSSMSCDQECLQGYFHCSMVLFTFLGDQDFVSQWLVQKKIGLKQVPCDTPSIYQTRATLNPYQGVVTIHFVVKLRDDCLACIVAIQHVKKRVSARASGIFSQTTMIAFRYSQNKLNITADCCTNLKHYNFSKIFMQLYLLLKYAYLKNNSYVVKVLMYVYAITKLNEKNNIFFLFSQEIQFNWYSEFDQLQNEYIASK